MLNCSFEEWKHEERNKLFINDLLSLNLWAYFIITGRSPYSRANVFLKQNIITASSVKPLILTYEIILLPKVSTTFFLSVKPGKGEGDREKS